MRPSDVRTFLFADIRGYTRFTREMGDEAAAALVERFAAIVRRCVEPRDGLLLETRGDEALVVFSSARQALRAAAELRQSFLAQKDEVVGEAVSAGIGLDAGEAVRVAGGFRGSA